MADQSDMMAVVYFSIRALIAIAIVSLDLGCSPASQPAVKQTDPIAGNWQGSWSYSTGMDIFEQDFRLEFKQANGHLRGRFLALENRHVSFMEKSKKVTVEKLGRRFVKIRDVVRTSVEQPAYRWSANGDCWNVTIDGRNMSGVLNGGPCSSIGIGSGARLIAVRAQRSP